MSVNARKILIVEDDRLSAEYLREILEEVGYKVVGIVASAEDSIIEAKLFEPDLILMDIILKGQLTGCEAAVRIKQNQKECKIVFLTAHAEAEMIDYAKQCQANSYLLKPYRDEEILATIAVVFSQNEAIPSTKVEEVNLSHGFSFNFKKCHLAKDGKQVPLNNSKLKLVEFLAKNVNTAVSNEQICQVIWGELKSNSTLRSLIYRIKQDIGTDLINNANGAGYVIRSGS